MGIFKAIKTGWKASVFTARVAGGVASGVVRGTVAVLETTNDSLDKINRRDWDGLEKTLGNGLQGVAVSAGRKIEALCELGGELEKAAERRDIDRFLTKANARRVASVATVGLALTGVSVAAVDGLDGMDAADGFDAADAGDAADAASAMGFAGNDLIPVDNGVFTGGDEELAHLAQAGQIEGTTHIDAADVDRDIAVRDAFLASHGFDGVPEGYEVHHVVPLSEGGADAPGNMVLVTEAQHATITAAHADFYHWHAS